MRTRTTNITLSISAALAILTGAAKGATTWTIPSAQTPTLQFALSSPTSPVQTGDTIVLTDASTYQTTYTVSKQNLTIMGAPGQDITIDGLQLGTVFSVDSSGSGLTLEGLRITHGRSYPLDDGGAIHIYSSVVTIRDCEIIDNEALDDGAGVYAETSVVTILDSVIADNANIGGGADSDGPGLFASSCYVVLDGCTFSGNATGSGRGGGMIIHVSTAHISNCDIHDNAADYGGGIYWLNSYGDATDTTIRANTADGDGGGLYHDNSSIEYTRCQVLDNATAGPDGDDGGGLYMANQSGDPVLMTSCLIARNTAKSQGGAGLVWEYSGYSLKLTNCTVADNTALGQQFGSGNGSFRVETGATLAIYNSILRGNTPASLTGNIVGAYSNVEVLLQGSGMINTDPMFVDAPGGDYRLASGSPSIDAGNSNYSIAVSPTDLDGNPRATDDPDTPDTGIAVFDLTVDQGAYEFQPSTTPPPASCPGDLDGDDDTDVFDFAIFAGDFGCVGE